MEGSVRFRELTLRYDVIGSTPTAQKACISLSEMLSLRSLSLEKSCCGVIAALPLRSTSISAPSPAPVQAARPMEELLPAPWRLPLAGSSPDGAKLMAEEPSAAEPPAADEPEAGEASTAA